MVEISEGRRVSCQFDDGKWYDGTIQELYRGKVKVCFDDGDIQRFDEDEIGESVKLLPKKRVNEIEAAPKAKKRAKKENESKKIAKRNETIKKTKKKPANLKRTAPQQTKNGSRDTKVVFEKLKNIEQQLNLYHQHHQQLQERNQQLQELHLQQQQQPHDVTFGEAPFLNEVISGVQSTLVPSRERLIKPKRVGVSCKEDDFFAYIVTRCWKHIKKAAPGNSWKIILEQGMPPQEKQQHLKQMFGEYCLFKELSTCKVFVDLRREVRIGWYLRKVKAYKELSQDSTIIETGQLTLNFSTDMIARQQENIRSIT